MAAIAFTSVNMNQPVGYEVIRRGLLVGTVTAGQLVTEGTTGYAATAAAATRCDGVALDGGIAGQVIDVLKFGEVEFRGINVGGTAVARAVPLSISAAVAGGLDNASPGANVLQFKTACNSDNPTVFVSVDCMP